MKKLLCGLLLCLPSSAWLASTRGALAAGGDDWAPPAVRAPSGLIGDAADRTVLLEWNANLEEELAGYRVYRNGRPIRQGLTSATEFDDRDLTNGEPCDYEVTAVLKDGLESPHSNRLRIVPRAIADLRNDVRVGQTHRAQAELSVAHLLLWCAPPRRVRQVWIITLMASRLSMA